MPANNTFWEKMSTHLAKTGLSLFKCELTFEMHRRLLYQDRSWRALVSLIPFWLKYYCGWILLSSILTPPPFSPHSGSNSYYFRFMCSTHVYIYQRLHFSLVHHCFLQLKFSFWIQFVCLFVTLKCILCKTISQPVSLNGLCGLRCWFLELLRQWRWVWGSRDPHDSSPTAPPPW